MNQDFASFVREASFHLTLSGQMIETILETERDMAHPHMGYGVILSGHTCNALYRRGLIVPAGKVKIPEEVKDNPKWPYDYILTEAGKLVAGLLREAGFKCDPRSWADLAPEPELEPVMVSLKPTAEQ